MWEEAAMLTIGLTGGIGAGKSTVAGILEDLGARIIDADRIGHEVYRPDTPGWSAVVNAFGEDVVAEDRTIDRKKLGARVFSDPADLRRLNALIHPLIAAEVRRRISELRAMSPEVPIVVEAAVLLEAGWDSLVDEVWVVVASRDLVVDRVVRDRGLSVDDVARRIDSQLPDADRIAGADCVIRNTGSPEALREEVKNAWTTRVAR